ncbi:MAG: response regulator [Candidatus Rokubacteria bacterium]|nr:response regulator [Candidatus Rokubacteria bacterium]
MERRRILVVDDDAIVLDAVAMMLSADNHEVHTASNRAQVLSLLEQGSYDVIVSDLRIPELDGPTFYRELKQRRPDALQRLLFMTGSTPAFSDFLEETQVPVLTKPFGAEDLRQAIRRVLAQHASARHVG